MKLTRYRSLIPVILVVLLISGSPLLNAQNAALAVLDTATLEQQMIYLQERTRIYNDFRAIRDDIFLKMKRNVVDSLNNEKLEVARLTSELTERDFEITTLNADLTRAREERDHAIRTKDSFSFIGIQMQKRLYSSIMWILVLALAGAAVLLFLMFKRSFVVTNQTKKELENTHEEFDTYRKTSREKYEKLVVSHHNEIMRLKRS